MTAIICLIFFNRLITYLMKFESTLKLVYYFNVAKLPQNENSEDNQNTDLITDITYLT